MSTTPYDRLEVAIADVHNIGHAIGILHWDQQVTMPDGGTPARAQQRETSHSVFHEKTTDDEIGSLLAEIDPDSLTGDQWAVVREVRRRYERQTAVPADLQRAIADSSFCRSST